MRGKRTEECPVCEGTGLRQNNKKCRACKGKGKIRTSDWLIRGMTEEEIARRKEEALADLVYVVRCKDCKYLIEHHYEEEGEKPYIKLNCKWSEYSHQPNDYCSFGKRREENG